MLGISYTVGELMQYFDYGPLFLRWHLSDFGWSFIWAFNINFIAKFSLRNSLLASGLSAIVFELLQFLMRDGDPIDLAVIILAIVIGLIILKEKKPKKKRNKSLK